MKIRSLHPDFFTDAKVTGLSFGARILFQGLWCRSDDYGRGRMLEKAIEGDVFPRDDVDILALLDELIRSGLIRSYQSGQDQFYFIPTWEKYQSPKYRAKSSIPEPPDETPSQMDPGQSGENPGQSAQELSLGEGEGEGEVEGVIAPAARTTLADLKTALVDLFGEPPPQNWSLYNRIATWIRDQGGTPEDVRLKAARIAEEWGPKACTVTALEKHWNRYDAEVGQLSAEDVKRYQAEVRRLQRRKEIHGT